MEKVLHFRTKTDTTLYFFIFEKRRSVQLEIVYSYVYVVNFRMYLINSGKPKDYKTWLTIAIRPKRFETNPCKPYIN